MNLNLKSLKNQETDSKLIFLTAFSAVFMRMRTPATNFQPPVFDVATIKTLINQRDMDYESED